MTLSELFIPGQTIGIIGGGHLARLLTLSAKSIGFHVGILAPEQGCTAAEVADWQIVADYTDQLAMVRMAEKCDVLTFEHLDNDLSLIRQVDELVSIPQSLELLEFPQDRLLERTFLDASNINIAPYAQINQIGDIEKNIEAIGFPCILKGDRGQGNAESQHVMKRISDIRGCLPLVREGTCILEAMIPFEKEITVMIVGNGNHDYSKFPIVETRYHKDGRFAQGIVPAELPNEITEEAYRIADDIAVTLNVQGILTIEMFVTEAGMIYVNSLAPGPHSAGHYSLEASNLSQFDAHIRGICGWQLPDIKLYSAAIMMNVASEQLIETISYIPFEKNWYHHYYGTTSLSKNDTVGHITILTDDVESELVHLEGIQIWEENSDYR